MMLCFIYRRAIARGFAVCSLVAALVAPAIALAAPAVPPPRIFPSQQTHYLRFTVSFNACVLAAGSCAVKVGALPYNAFVVRGYQQIVTNFNSGTTDTVSVGVSPGNANELVAAQSVHAGAGGITALTLAATGSGTQATGAGATQSGSNGGFDVWVKYSQTGFLPTAGTAVIVLEYFAPNDGTCTAVPSGASAPAC
jgi:hypothetical protein